MKLNIYNIVENHMNKYRLKWVNTYEEIHSVRENIDYERIYWPKSQIFYDYIDMDFEVIKDIFKMCL